MRWQVTIEDETDWPETMTMWASLKWTALVLALLMVGIALFIGVFDWNWARGIVANKVSKAIGHAVTIEGDLDMDWSWPPTIRADNIRVANAAWSPELYMLTLRQLVLQIDLRALLKGQVVLPMVELQEPIVLLESSAEGLPNWLSSATPETPTPPQQATNLTFPTIGRVALYAGRFSHHDYSTDNTFGGTLSEIRAQTVGPIDTLTDSQASAKQPETESDDASSRPLLDVEVTRAVNVMLNFQGQHVIIAKQTLTNVSAIADLRDGHLTFEPTFTLAGGSAAG